MNIFKLIKEFFLQLFGAESDPTVEPPVVVEEPPGLQQPPVVDYPVEEEWEDEEDEEEEEKPSEPVKSKRNAVITSCLWKPISENDGNPVVLVSCDGIKTSDLNLEIIGKGRKLLKVAIDRMPHRANHLGGHEYARIHFRVQRNCKKFKTSAPIKLRFYRKIKGEKVRVKVLGKNAFTIRKPTHRTGS